MMTEQVWESKGYWAISISHEVLTSEGGTHVTVPVEVILTGVASRSLPPRTPTLFTLKTPACGRRQASRVQSVGTSVTTLSFPNQRKIRCTNRTRDIYQHNVSFMGLRLVNMSVRLSVLVRSFCICLPISVYLCVFSLCLPVCLSFSLSCLPPSLCLCVLHSVFDSVSVCLSVCLSVTPSRA